MIKFIFALFLIVNVALAAVLPVFIQDDNHEEFVLVPLERARRSPYDTSIKAGGIHSSKYGSGGQIEVNHNLYKGKHHSIDLKGSYNQYGRFKEGKAGINYQLSW